MPYIRKCFTRRSFRHYHFLLNGPSELLQTHRTTVREVPLCFLTKSTQLLLQSYEQRASDGTYPNICFIKRMFLKCSQIFQLNLVTFRRRFSSSRGRQLHNTYRCCSYCKNEGCLYYSFSHFHVTLISKHLVVSCQTGLETIRVPQ
jgi:hypothetical protein